MSFSLADARFLFDRATGLFRRGWLSLRTRGWRASWERVRAQWHRVPAARRAALFFPAAEPAVPASLATSRAPRASIVIPVYGHLAHTLACLRAIAAHPPLAPFEVIVVDDASPDASADTLATIDGLVLHRRTQNAGFIAACNDGASLAIGDVLAFINNDTIPQPGWLDALLDTFDAHPDAGLVGAQLLYPDGRLQEAGGVVFADGSGWNYGRFGAPADPRFASLRDCRLRQRRGDRDPAHVVRATRRLRCALRAGVLRGHRPRLRRARRRPSRALPAARAHRARRRHHVRHRCRQRHEGLPGAQPGDLRCASRPCTCGATGRGHDADTGHAASQAAAGADHRRADADTRS